MTLRRIITKLIIRVGTDRVRQATAKEHIPLVSYVERCRRKKQNARERTKLLALLGQKLKSKDEQKEDESELDSDSEGETMPQGDQALDSDSSDYSDSESDDDVAGTDQLQSSVKLDIPVVYDIPIVSQLAKEQKVKSVKQTVTDVMDADELDVETHFVENPFIRVRERASKN